MRGGQGPLVLLKEDGDTRRDGHAVGFDLADGVAELRRKMRARHHKAHGQRAALRQLFYNAAQQAVFGARAGDDAQAFFRHLNPSRFMK